MPIGRRGRRLAAAGFTYLGLLFFVAITAAALAALGQRWSMAAQRERERELEFRGQEIARAIEAYVATSPQGPAAYPRSLDDLLIDGRGVRPRHHLRRAYADPFTGEPDWVLIRPPAGGPGFYGVHSRSEQLLLRRSAEPAAGEIRAQDRHFVAGQGALPAAPAASAPETGQMQP
jgi:type II secretory pathway pseudopilin PulG